MPDESSVCTDDAQALALFRSFKPNEVRVMSLAALGWRGSDIGEWLRLGEGPIINACRRKADLREKDALGLFYVDNLLRFDTHGGRYKPGEKHALWVAGAEKRRDALYKALSPAMRLGVMIMATPETVELSDDDLAELLRPRVMSGSTLRDHISKACAILRDMIDLEQRERKAAGLRPAPLPRGRGRMITTMRLAPFPPE